MLLSKIDLKVPIECGFNIRSCQKSDLVDCIVSILYNKHILSYYQYKNHKSSQYYTLLSLDY